MTLNDFYDWLKAQPLQDKLVHIIYKYPWEDNWIEANEYLEVNIDCNDYIWLKDWFEGQDDVVILGCIDVDEIEIPLFK